MIGQANLIQSIDNIIEQDKWNRFTIIYGDKGQGKKTLALHIADKLDAMIYKLPDLSVDTIRKMKETIYKQKTKLAVIIPDADMLSTIGKNALLKITEDLINNVYIIMTLEDIYSTLPTLRSRANIIPMELYTTSDIRNYYISQVSDYTEEELNIVLDMCTNMGQVNTLIKCGVLEFYNYVKKVVDNISTVSGANAFKITDKIAIKEEDEGYDLLMFLKMFNIVCAERLDTKQGSKMSSAIIATHNAITQLKIKGVNKQYVLDGWILEVRKVWR